MIKISENLTLLKLLESIEQRPQMYIKEKNLDLLESFISGYFLCQTENTISSPDDMIFKSEFYNWIYPKYQYLTNDISWVEFIKQISKKENKDEFPLFFELLKDFKKEKELK